MGTPAQDNKGTEHLACKQVHLVCVRRSQAGETCGCQTRRWHNHRKGVHLHIKQRSFSRFVVNVSSVEEQSHGLFGQCVRRRQREKSRPTFECAQKKVPKCDRVVGKSTSKTA